MKLEYAKPVGLLIAFTLMVGVILGMLTMRPSNSNGALVLANTAQAAQQPAAITVGQTATNTLGACIGGYTSEQVLDMLVQNADERKLARAFCKDMGDAWEVSTKAGLDPNGAPCCGTPITFNMKEGGQYDYWLRFPQPTGTGFTLESGLDPGRTVDTSYYSMWRATAQKGSNGTFRSDGVTWIPLGGKIQPVPTGTAASNEPPGGGQTGSTPNCDLDRARQLIEEAMRIYEACNCAPDTKGIAPSSPTTPTVGTPPAATATVESKSSMTVTADDLTKWTGVSGWKQDGDEWALSLGSGKDKQICLSKDFPSEAGFFKYGSGDGKGGWPEKHLQKAGDCTVNQAGKKQTVADIRFVPKQ